MREPGLRLDADDDYRARRYFEAPEVGGLTWAVEYDQPSAADAAIGKILREPW